MRFKRAGAALLAAALSATSMGIYAYAEEDAAMKKALTYVKQRIDIPESYSNFSSRNSTTNGKTSYRFYWSDDEKGESINVTITGKVINNLSYDRDYDEDYWKPKFAKLSDKKILSAAKKYLKQINPSIYDQIEIDEESPAVSLYGDAYVSFHRVENGVPVQGQDGHIAINKDTGELNGYWINWINGATFSDTKDAISKSDAQKSFKKLFPVELVYTLSYDWMEQTYTPHLIYRQTQNGQINAFTGELSTFDDYGYYPETETAYDEGDDAVVADDDADDDVNPATGAASVKFSDEEIKQLEKENTLIKADEAMKRIAKLGIFFIPANSEVQYQNCYYNERQDMYVRDVQFSANSAKYIDLSGDGEEVPIEGITNDSTVWGSFSINAETGDILNFYCYAPDNKTNMDADTYQTKANDALKKLLGDKWTTDFGDLKNTYNDTIYTNYDPKTGKPIGDGYVYHRTYQSQREAYNIPCLGENVSITFSNIGYVTNYRLNYHPEIEYPKPDNIITEKKAYSSFFKQVDLGLKYRLAYRTDTKQVVSALVYSADQNLYIDAFTGKLTNGSGTEFNENTENGGYKDIADSKYKTYAEKLQKYGITLMTADGKLNESAPITANDFRVLLNQIGFRTSNDGIDAKDELTRQKAAKILVAGKYGTELPEMTSLYNNKFTDVKADSKYLGYIMIADASGLLPGNGDKYDPKAAFTRGEALKFAYNYLSK